MTANNPDAEGQRGAIITTASIAVLLVLWEIFGRDINPIFGSYPSAIFTAFLALLRNGKRCVNAAVPGTRYCSLPAHAKLAEMEAQGLEIAPDQAVSPAGADGGAEADAAAPAEAAEVEAPAAAEAQAAETPREAASDAVMGEAHAEPANGDGGSPAAVAVETDEEGGQ
jgi:hypothetical protein